MAQHILSFLKSLDSGWFFSINHGLHNIFFNGVMPLISNSGSGGLIWISFGLALLLLGSRETKKASVIMLFALFISFLLGEEVLKFLFHRARPFETLPGVYLLVPPPHSYSFPSAHAANAFASAMVLARKIPVLSLPVNIFAVVMAFSRVYVGVHYPLDVLAGAALGAVCAAFVLKYEDVIFGAAGRVKPPFIP